MEKPISSTDHISVLQLRCLPSAVMQEQDVRSKTWIGRCCRKAVKARYKARTWNLEASIYTRRATTGKSFVEQNKYNDGLSHSEEKE